jgi:hypothetical protein
MTAEVERKAGALDHQKEADRMNRLRGLDRPASSSSFTECHERSFVTHPGPRKYEFALRPSPIDPLQPIYSRSSMAPLVLPIWGLYQNSAHAFQVAGREVEH